MMSSSNLDQTSTLCGACGFLLTEAEKIITCSYCEQTYHSCCVDNTAADTEWYCPEGCRNNPDDLAEQAREQPDAATEMDCPAVGQAEEFDTERWIREKQFEIELELAERQAQIDRELREKEEKMSEAIRKVMRRQEANLELERKKKANHERRMAELQNSFKRRSSIIDEQLELTKFGFEKIPQRPQIVDLTSEEVAEDEKKIEGEESSSETSEDRDEGVKSSVKNSDESGAKLNKRLVSRSPNGLGQQCSGLEKARLAAGGGYTRQPPCYPNDPEVWPKSFGTREGSSKAYGVTDERNLAGLRDWLKGAARNTGRSLVDCPELLPLSHPKSARGLEHPEADKRVKIISIESAGEQLCGHMQATDLTLLNPFAKKDPGSVPPDGGERHWATKKTGATNFPYRINPVTISGESSRRQQEKPTLYCQKEDKTWPDRADEKQQVACHDHQLRFWIGKLSGDEPTKIVASWICGEIQKLEKRSQSDTCLGHYSQVVLPVVSTVRTSTPTVFQMVSYQRYERNTVALIGGAKVVRLDLGDVRGKLARQWTAEASHVWPRFTRIKEVSAAQYSSIVKADDGQLQELIGMLIWMLSAVTTTGNHHQGAPKAPDKPKKQSPMQESVANVQQDPTETDAASGSAHGSGPDEALQEVDRDHTRMTAASSTNMKPVQQRNLLSAELDLKVQAEDDDFLKLQWRNRRERTDEAKSHVPKNGGCDESGAKLHQSHKTPLRHPGVSLLAMKSCNVHGFDDDEGGQKLHGNATNLPGSVAFSTVNARQLDSAARECVRTGENAGSAFAMNRIVQGNLLGLDGAQRLTAGNSRTTNPSVVKSDRFAVDNNEQSQQPETTDRLKQESRTAVLGVFGKSYEPDGPKDVTGWGVTTAEMGALPYGGRPTV